MKPARMKRSFRMGQLIRFIEKKFGLDFTKPGTYIKLDGRGFMDLSIGNAGLNRVSVAHYYEQNGDAMLDPDMVFLRRKDGEWYPVEITQPAIHIVGMGTMGGYSRLAEVDEKGGIRFNRRRQADAATFANQWAVNLGRQSFREADALKVERPPEDDDN